jgi:hypothetical protein
MAIYKLNQHSTESEPSSVTLNEGDGLFICIPFDPDNTDYQTYLKWVEAGNTPEAAD